MEMNWRRSQSWDRCEYWPKLGEKVRIGEVLAMGVATFEANFGSGEASRNGLVIHLAGSIREAHPMLNSRLLVCVCPMTSNRRS
jgi:hypothetical protein